MNVGCDDGTYYVSDEKQQGVHWALLALDIKSNRIHYGVSLGWPLPSNLSNTVGSNLKILDTTFINKLSDAGFISSDSCKLFYTLQSCSNVCGVIVVCMVAILCDHWNSWLTWDK